MRNIRLTDSRWPKEYDRTMTRTNLNNWTWPNLKPTNLTKLTNLNLTSRVLLISVPDVFFLVEVQSDAASKAGWPFQADRTNIFFGGKVNVCRCREFRSCSNIKVCRCKYFLAKIWPKFGHLNSVMWTSHNYFKQTLI